MAGIYYRKVKDVRKQLDAQGEGAHYKYMIKCGAINFLPIAPEIRKFYTKKNVAVKRLKRSTSIPAIANTEEKNILKMRIKTKSYPNLAWLSKKEKQICNAKPKTTLEKVNCVSNSPHNDFGHDDTDSNPTNSFCSNSSCNSLYLEEAPVVSFRYSDVHSGPSNELSQINFDDAMVQDEDSECANASNSRTQAWNIDDDGNVYADYIDESMSSESENLNNRIQPINLGNDGTSNDSTVSMNTDSDLESMCTDSDTESVSSKSDTAAKSEDSQCISSDHATN